MIKVICPRCANTHLSDEVHEGKFLRCAKCGDAVQIGARSENQIEVFEASANVHSKPITRGFGLKLRRRVFRGKRLAWIYVLLLSAAMALIWYFYPSNPDIFDNASVPKKPTELRTGDPYSDGVDTAARLPVSYHATGDVVTVESSERGRGNLTLINGTGLDSVVLLVKSQTGEIARSIYVSANTTGVIKGVAIGKYKVRATLGSGWSDAGNTFTKYASYFMYPQSSNFTEEEIGDEIKFDRMSLTLHEVPNGNIQKEPISKAQFWPSTGIAK